MRRAPETVEQLASRLGCSVETAAMFQRKPRTPKASTLGKLNLVGGREQLRARLDELPRPKNAHSAGGDWS